MPEDIQHVLEDLAGAVYGSVVQILKHALPPSGADTR